MGFCGSCQHNAAAPLDAGNNYFKSNAVIVPGGMRSISRLRRIPTSGRSGLKIPSTGRRSTLHIAVGACAAQSAAVDFASFRFTCGSNASPELKWQAYW